jgi:hypothetical protein
VRQECRIWGRSCSGSCWAGSSHAEIRHRRFRHSSNFPGTPGFTPTITITSTFSCLRAFPLLHTPNENIPRLLSVVVSISDALPWRRWSDAAAAGTVLCSTLRRLRCNTARAEVCDYSTWDIDAVQFYVYRNIHAVLPFHCAFARLPIDRQKV